MAFVVEPSVQVVYGFVDAAGHRATVTVFMSDGEVDPEAGGPLALGTAMQAISADHINTIACRIRASEAAPGAATDGPYARGADKVNLVFRGAEGSAARMQIGAPNEGILDTDAIEVDRADAAVIALVDAMTTYGKTAEGAALTGLQLGYRKRNANRKGL